MNFFRRKKTTISKIIVGLGNPGKKYENTRHNAGFMALEQLMREYNSRLNKVQFRALTDIVKIKGEKVLLMAPQTYMNLSGNSVLMAMEYYDLTPDDIITLSDDIELDIGTLRIRRKGSHGGQKGLKSIYSLIKTDEVPRIKIGVGKKPHPEYDLSSWVLSNFTPKEQKIMEDSLKNIPKIIELMVEDDLDAAMNLYSK